jgi:hypothetical protein
MSCRCVSVGQTLRQRSHLARAGEYECPSAFGHRFDGATEVRPELDLAGDRALGNAADDAGIEDQSVR